MRRTLRTATVLLVPSIAITGLASSAYAADRRVPQDFATIEEAVTAASAGDRIVVSGGVHREKVTVAGKNGLAFVGKGSPVWDGNVSGDEGTQLHFTGDGLTVSGFRFRNGTNQIHVEGNMAAVSRCTSDRPLTNFVLAQGGNFTAERCLVRRGNRGFDVRGADSRVSRSLFNNISSEALEISGADAVVERNVLRVCGSKASLVVMGTGCAISGNQLTKTEGICLQGDDGLVEGNTCDGGSFQVEGTNTRVLGNVMKNGRSGFYLSGAGLRAEGNLADNCRGDGIYFNAQNGHGTILRNTIRGTDGIRYDDANRMPRVSGGTVSGNRLEDCVFLGIQIVAVGTVVNDNTLLRCGRRSTPAMNVVGDGCQIESNTALDCYTAFIIDGDGNVLENCIARESAADGFVIHGAGNTVSGCTATSCGGEGLENHGTLTRVLGSKLSKNRIDLAAMPDATFDGTVGATYTTGSPTTFPEVESYMWW